MGLLVVHAHELDPTAAEATTESRNLMNPVVAYLATLSPGSRPTILAALANVATLAGGSSPHGRGALRTDPLAFPWHLLRYPQVNALRSRLAEGYPPAAANQALSALRGVVRECRKLGLMSAESAHACLEVRGVRGTRLPAGRSLSHGEIRALFGACNPATALGARNAALLALLFGSGLRRAEVVALDVEHFRAPAGELVVRGKGNRERMAYTGRGAQEALAAWLAFRGDSLGPLLLAVRKGGAVVHGSRLSPHAVLVALRRLAQNAGVTEPFSPHDMRRTFITELLDGGVDLGVVQGMAGHASITTTTRYDRRGERAKKRAAEVLHVPFAATPRPPGGGEP